MPVATWNDSTITWDSSLADWNGNYSAVVITDDTLFKAANINALSAANIRAGSAAQLVPELTVANVNSGRSAAQLAPTSTATYHE